MEVLDRVLPADRDGTGISALMYCRLASAELLHVVAQVGDRRIAAVLARPDPGEAMVIDLGEGRITVETEPVLLD